MQHNLTKLSNTHSSCSYLMRYLWLGTAAKVKSIRPPHLLDPVMLDGALAKSSTLPPVTVTTELKADSDRKSPTVEPATLSLKRAPELEGGGLGEEVGKETGPGDDWQLAWLSSPSSYTSSAAMLALSNTVVRLTVIALEPQG
jgi:hypothetical protein